MSELPSIYEFAKSEIGFQEETIVTDGVDSSTVDFLLAAYPRLPERAPGGFTVQEAAAIWGVGRSTANRRCLKLFKEGKLTAENCLMNHTIGLVYYPVEET